MALVDDDIFPRRDARHDRVRRRDVARLHPNEVPDENVARRDGGLSAAPHDPRLPPRLGDVGDALELGAFLRLVRGGHRRHQKHSAEDGRALDPPGGRRGVDDLRGVGAFERELREDAGGARGEEDAEGVVLEGVEQEGEERAPGPRGEGVGPEPVAARGEEVCRGGRARGGVGAKGGVERVDAAEGREGLRAKRAGVRVHERAEVRDGDAEGGVGGRGGRRGGFLLGSKCGELMPSS